MSYISKWIFDGECKMVEHDITGIAPGSTYAQIKAVLLAQSPKLPWESPDLEMVADQVFSIKYEEATALRSKSRHRMREIVNKERARPR